MQTTKSSIRAGDNTLVYPFIVGVALVSSLLVGCKKAEGPSGPPPGAMPVSVVSLQATQVPISAEAVAQTEGASEVEVRPRVGGIVLKKQFHEGETVKLGQTLFLIDPAPFQIALAQAKAQLAEQKARVEQAQRETARLQSLLASQSVSQREYDNMVSDFAVAKAGLLQYEAAVKEAELNLSYTTVKSPANGVAGRFVLSEGALVNANTSLLTTIVQVSPIWVRFSLSESELTPLGGYISEKSIKDIRLVLPNGQEYSGSGKLNFAASVIDPALGTQQLRAEFENKDHQLLPGQFVRARVVTGQRDGVFLVPQTAVLTGDQGKFVFVVDQSPEGKSIATVRPVEVGTWLGQQWIILNGLKEGEQVIVDNLIKLRPGVEVKPTLVTSKPVSQLEKGVSSAKASVHSLKPSLPAKSLSVKQGIGDYKHREV